MPTFKTLRFDMLTPGAEFTFEASPAPIDVDTTKFTMVKATASSAYVKEIGEKSSKRFTIRACERCLISIPDPTPEEIAAKAAEDKANVEKWARRAVERKIESCETSIAKFAARLAVNPTDAFEWGNDAAIASGNLLAFKVILAVFDEKGYEVAKDHDLAQALQGARCPQHSTSTLSNLVNEAKTAAYADFASNQL
jgi:hypothetical protein